MLSTTSHPFRPGPATAPKAASAARLDGERVELAGSACPMLAKCIRTGPCDLTQPIQVSIILRRPVALELPEDAFEPLSREGFSKYNATAAQIRSVQKFARQFGLSVSSEDPSTRTVKVQGNSAQMGRAFGVHLATYQDPQGTQFRGYQGQIKLPVALARQVDGVFGLENRGFMQPLIAPTDGVSPHIGMGPSAIASAYKFPKGTTGAGQTIGIIQLGGGYKAADLKSYFSQWGIHAPIVTSVSVDGGQNAPGKPSTADAEVEMDVEVAGGVAPGAKIVVYFAPNTEQGFIDAVNQAAHDNQNKPNTLSISWGGAENQWSQQGHTNMSNAFKDAAALGVNIFTSSGDKGAKDGQKDGKNHTDFPSSVPYAISCGGTKLSGGFEVAWNDAGGASGGGVSDVFPETAWQKAGASVPAPVNPAGGRGVPDVAGNASPSTGYDVTVDGNETTQGGTSAVAPLWAGLTARLGQGLGRPVGFLPPLLYRKDFAADFTDIKSGDNGGFKAGPGWDPVTGLGSPNGEKLLASLKAVPASALSHIA